METQTIEDFVSNINWQLLASQKLKLLLMEDEVSSLKEKEAVQGIINLIDGLQDVAVDYFKVNKDEVFPMDSERRTIQKGDAVDVPDPDTTTYDDIHNHAFRGTVIGFNKQYAIVADGDDEAFWFEPGRLTIVWD